MILALAVVLAVVILWSVVAKRVESMFITLPLALIAVGIAVGWESSSAIFDHLTDPLLERTVEVVLALLLFLDATEVGRVHRRDAGVLVRLVLIGVPLSLFTGTVVIRWLYPEMRVALCFVLACVVVPTDMAPASAVVKDRRLPRRVRDVLNTESGYNDGIVAPFFLLGIAFLAGGHDVTEKGAEALAEMVPAATWAVGIGAPVGAGLDLRAVVLAVAAVTVVRVLPVLVVLLFSSLTWRDRLLVGWLGPRGIASIVFALLAIQHVDGDDFVLVIQVVSLTVVLSAVVHGVSAPLIARRLTRSREPGTGSGDQ
ncbi:cation:proton antiporter domain-containing protein [Kocuria tytonis]|uniref:Cation/H+ exchanger transmembrane domain-containing protein n=1 Tax=Kocuria tytonis TaxID=2054280 RepID=A0A495A3N1_9MICC|nr:cation:proton antiporter [Kocuria tytonis]RKQ33761.1 hypothetical protein C1C97_011215 [Kocuria tytonis]